METIPSRQHFAEAAAAIRQVSLVQPKVGIVLGSGLSALADAVQQATSIDFGDIPHFPISTIPGHRGRLVLGELEGQAVALMQGRTHYYEGYSIRQVTLPIRVLRLLGVETLILTNAAGGLNPRFRSGDLMLIVDQINLLGMGGTNPLRGPNDPGLGPRFLDMSTTYDRGLRELAWKAATAENIPMHQGVYVGLAGPTFESPAEIRFLRLIGGDAVGMSTTSEAIVARHSNMRVLGISGISNVAIDQVDSPSQASHEEVLEAGALLAPRMIAVVRRVLMQL